MMEIGATGSVPNMTPGLRPAAASSPAPGQTPESSPNATTTSQSQRVIPATQQAIPALGQPSVTQPAAPSATKSEPNPSAARQDPRGLRQELSSTDHRVIQELRARDRQVRAHEQAHLSAGGSIAKGAPSFQFTVGPDGRRYAVGGEVAIDASRAPGDPQATIRKAQAIRRAALAPAAPSAQDQRVAAQATRMEQQARAELSREQEAVQSVGELSDEETVEPGFAGIGTNETQAPGSVTGRRASPTSQAGGLKESPADELNVALPPPPGRGIDIFA